MDRRSWLWRRKSSEKSPGEAESSGSVSSHSERYSDDQEVSKASPNLAQSPEVSSNVASCEDTVKSLTEKLASALLSIRAKEDLVNQHAKVAEEAVSGWEKAEKEVVSLRQQLEAAAQKNSTLEERISQLDGALKECVRQTRKEQEQRVQNALVKKNEEWESEKFELESRLVAVEVQLEAAKEVHSSISHDLQFKLESIDKENAILRSELLAQSEELNIRTLERDLSNHAAETASKQYLESIKKVAMLEAECRMLQAMVRKSSSCNHKSYLNSVFVESHGNRPSDTGERLPQLDNKLSCSDMWASALISEFDQFKSGKAVGQNSIAISVEINLMDDFLEMEKLVALHEPSPFIDPQVKPSADDITNSSLEAEVKALLEKISELEANERRTETEKAEMERLLGETQGHLESAHKQLKETEMKLADLQRQLQFARDSKQAAEIAMATAGVQRKLLESQLESADREVKVLHEKLDWLEGEIEEERALSAELNRKCQNVEDELLRRKREAEIRRAAITGGELKIKQEKELAAAAKKYNECQQTIASIGQQLKSLTTLDEFMCEDEKAELDEGSPPVSEREKIRKIMNDASESTSGPSSFLNRNEGHSPPLSSPSPSSYFQDMQSLSLKVGSIVV